MKKISSLLALLSLLIAVLVACGATPEPTEPPPTQTPWVVVVTSTTKAEDVAQVQPTSAPPTTAATPTQTQEPTAAPTEAAPTEAAPTEPAATEPAATESATASPEPTETSATPTQEPEPPTPTKPPEPSGFKYPPPVLLEPPNNRPVSYRGSVILKWSPVGELAEDEYYHLHLERPPKIEGVEWWGDYVYLKEPEYVLEGAFLDAFHYSADYGHAVVYWWVRVVRKTGEDASGKPIGIDISAYSEKRTLILDPKPEGR